MEKIIYLVFGAAITFLITNFGKWVEKRNDLKKQNKIFIKFIDDIVIKYLTMYVEQYEKILEDIDKDELFDSRVMTTSPMLNKGIFDFFEKSDLIKIFAHCKKNSLVDVYHNFYEIDFLQKKSPFCILNKYIKKILAHFEKHKSENETLEQHKVWCGFYDQQRGIFTQEIEIQKKHSETLIESFKQIKAELESIDELNYEDY